MYIKGFDTELKCRGFQFEIGETYKIEHTEPMKLCTNTVFHFCDSLSKVHQFYNVDRDNRFCVIEALGEVITDGSKCGSDHIRIIRELTEEELKIMTGRINGNAGLFNSGYRNSGDMNSGDRNSGDMNSGYMNSGYMNSGYMNSGYMNSGDRNSGIANKCNESNGVFCNESDMNIRIFNKPSGMSLHDFYNSKFWVAMCSESYELTVWESYTEEERAADPEKDRRGGHLVGRTPEEAWAEWWEKLTDENREIIKQIPNFDPDVFKDITGIEV